MEREGETFQAYDLFLFLFFMCLNCYNLEPDLCMQS